MSSSPKRTIGAVGPGIRKGGDGRDFDVLVVGEILADLIVRAADPRPVFGQVERYVDSVDLVMGSSSVIFACGAAALGLRVAVAGLAGDDALGRFMLASMAERGLDTSAVRLDPDRPTGASVVLASPVDRAILTAPGTTPFMRVDDVPPKLLRRARHVHAGAVYVMDGLRPELPSLFRTARAGGATTSFDTNWDPTDTWQGGIRQILAETDVFLPNEAEATRIAHESNPEAAARALVAMGARVVAVKLGPAGAIAIAADGRLAHCRAPHVEPVDSTGAGDTFDAGFIATWLAGRPLEECLAIAVACGSLSTRAVGGTAGQPTLDEAEALARAAGILP
jgi:sugar/nucleoside kinase (ribokinase family)